MINKFRYKKPPTQGGGGGASNGVVDDKNQCINSKQASAADKDAVVDPVLDAATKKRFKVSEINNTYV